MHEASIDEDKADEDRQSGPAAITGGPAASSGQGERPADVHWITKPTAGRVRVVIAFAGLKTEKPGIAEVAKLPQTSFGLKDIVVNLRKWAIDPDRRFEDLVSMIVGVHVRFWHAPPARLIPLLAAAGAPKSVLKRVVECL